MTIKVDLSNMKTRLKMEDLRLHHGRALVAMVRVVNDPGYADMRERFPELMKGITTLPDQMLAAGTAASWLTNVSDKVQALIEEAGFTGRFGGAVKSNPSEHEGPVGEWVLGYFGLSFERAEREADRDDFEDFGFWSANCKPLLEMFRNCIEMEHIIADRTGIHMFSSLFTPPVDPDFDPDPDPEPDPDAPSYPTAQAAGAEQKPEAA